MKKIIAITLLVVFVLCSCAFAEGATEYTELSKGSKGDTVVELQNRLNELGYSVGKADGSFGGKTEKAIEQFQRYNYLEVTGIADESTQKQLFSENAMTKKEAESRELQIAVAGIDFFRSLALDAAESLYDSVSYDTKEVYMYHPDWNNKDTYEFTVKVKSGSTTSGYGWSNIRFIKNGDTWKVYEKKKDWMTHIYIDIGSAMSRIPGDLVWRDSDKFYDTLLKKFKGYKVIDANEDGSLTLDEIITPK